MPPFFFASNYFTKLEFIAQSTPICHCEGRKARGNLQQDGMIM